MIPNRRLHPGEAKACFVGSGECLINAAWETDDGTGNPCYVCGVHLQELEELEKIIEKMPKDQVDKFAKLVDKAHEEMKRKPK